MNYTPSDDAYVAIQNQSRIDNASPVEIICLLYEGAITRLIQAKVLLRQDKVPILRREELSAKTTSLLREETIDQAFTSEADAQPLVALSEELAKLAEEVEYARRYTKAVNGAIQILVGLQDALDFSDDEFQIAENLDKIYTYCITRIGEADATRDLAIFDEVIGHLKTLKEAWDEIAKKAH